MWPYDRMLKSKNKFSLPVLVMFHKLPGKTYYTVHALFCFIIALFLTIYVFELYYGVTIQSCQATIYQYSIIMSQPVNSCTVHG